VQGRRDRRGHDPHAPATAEELAVLQRLTERYCVVFQSLTTPPKVEVEVTS
jgi:hypothetical protein